MATAMPPLPPEVTEQQVPPMVRIAQMRAAQGMGGPPPMDDTAMQSASALDAIGKILDDVAQKLSSAAKLVSISHPEWLPILKPVVAGLSMLSNEVQSTKAKGATGQGEPGLEPSQATEGPGAQLTM